MEIKKKSSSSNLNQATWFEKIYNVNFNEIDHGENYMYVQTIIGINDFIENFHSTNINKFLKLKLQ